MKQYLIVIDMQNDFIDGSLGTAEAQAMLPEAVKRIRECGEAVRIATMDTHTEDYLQTAEGRKLPVTHCVKGTPGWEIAPAVKEALEDCIILEKPTFGSVKLPDLIEDPESIELLGLCTDICVVSNALLLKAHFPEVPIRVNSRCCAGVTPEKHRAALETMASCQIEII